jgi:hypothetical protein
LVSRLFALSAIVGGVEFQYGVYELEPEPPAASPVFGISRPWCLPG